MRRALQEEERGAKARVTVGLGGGASKERRARGGAYWKGDEGVAQAIRRKVAADEAKGVRLGGSRKMSAVDRILARKYRPDEEAVEGPYTHVSLRARLG